MEEAIELMRSWLSDSSEFFGRYFFFIRIVQTDLTSSHRNAIVKNGKTSQGFLSAFRKSLILKEEVRGLLLARVLD